MGADGWGGGLSQFQLCSAIFSQHAGPRPQNFRHIGGKFGDERHEGACKAGIYLRIGTKTPGSPSRNSGLTVSRLYLAQCRLAGAGVGEPAEVCEDPAVAHATFVWLRLTGLERLKRAATAFPPQGQRYSCSTSLPERVPDRVMAAGGDSRIAQSAGEWV